MSWELKILTQNCVQNFHCIALLDRAYNKKQKSCTLYHIPMLNCLIRTQSVYLFAPKTSRKYISYIPSIKFENKTPQWNVLLKSCFMKFEKKLKRTRVYTFQIKQDRYRPVLRLLCNLGFYHIISISNKLFVI